LKKVFDWKRYLIEKGIWLKKAFDWNRYLIEKCIRLKMYYHEVTYANINICSKKSASSFTCGFTV
jgi:hypothetical protein